MNIWAVGRNYGAHAKELGNAVPSTPMIFLKAGSAIVHDESVPLWRGSDDIHHEIEIALRFQGTGDDLFFDAVALALDLTARDHQTRLKADGHPWTLAKSFKASCPISSFVAIPVTVPHFKFDLFVNDERRQTGDTHDMIFDFETLRRYVLENFPVQSGDILLTGTPAGVAKLRGGDRARATLASESGHQLVANWLFC